MHSQGEPAMFRTTILSLLIFSTLGSAQHKPGDMMIEKYLAQETAKLSQRFMDGARTLQEWQDRRPRLKQEYFEMLGLWPLPEKTPLHATVTGTLERDDFVVEKLHFQSKPGLYVTGNLYRPKKIAGKLPAVLYVCGHSGKGRDGNKTAFQDHGMWFATNGYICLIIDTLQLGEIPGVHHGTYREGRWWWQARGYTPAGVECWNGIRAIDYLVSRPDVDAERIAVTGISGGGASTIWIAAADDRVKCAVPVSGMSDLESYVTNKIINGHCDCMLMINTYQWEWTTIAALIAPRPMLFCNSDNDRIFPMDGNRRIIERLRKCYAMYGKPELVDDYVSHGGHDYRPDLRIAVFKWINKHIKGDAGTVKDADFKLIPGQELRVFPEDRDVPKDALNGRIDEIFAPAAQIALPSEKSYRAWKAHLLKRLQEKSFRVLSENLSRRLTPAFEKIGEGGGLWRRVTTDPAIEVVVSASSRKRDNERNRTLLVNDLQTGEGADIAAWASRVLEEERVHILQPRGRGTKAWTTKSPPNYVERSHALLGSTADEGRVWDTISTMKSYGADDSEKNSWRVIGRGQTGILAAYAALFEPSVAEVIIVDPPTSHRDGPIFLNILRVLDIPEALGLLAPKKLTLINAKDKAFDRTVEIYKLAGAADKIMRK
jgi:dienelactone hydrolase